MAAGNEIVIDKKKSGLILPGALISCTTNLGDKIRGEVIGYDEDAKAVIIKSATTGGKEGSNSSKSFHDITIVNLNLIDESNFHIEQKSSGEMPPLPDIDKAKIDRRLRSAKERVGIGVSTEGQQLFDHIRRTIQECQWDARNILVLDEVEIVPPYRVENCSGKTKKSVDYIKNIVNKFYADLVQANVSPPSGDAAAAVAT